jgi:hypothetical protein
MIRRIYAIPKSDTVKGKCQKVSGEKMENLHA